MREVTGYPPVMWGPGIVGFDRYHYRYASGRELADDLNRYLEGRAVRARPLNVAQRAARWARRSTSPSSRPSPRPPPT